MELNSIRIGKHFFQLEKGDRFFTNGSCFDYVPIGKENREKLPFRDYHKHTTISAKKWEKLVRKADNIKDLGTGYFSVQYAYKEEVEQKEGLWSLAISLTKGIMATELHIERETKEIYFLKKGDPISGYSKIMKSDLGKIKIEESWKLSGSYESVLGSYTIVKFDDYDATVDKLIQALDEYLNKRLITYQDLVVDVKNKILDFKDWKKQQGYVEDNSVDDPK